MDGAHSQNSPLFIDFVDFKKAFDSINQDMMFAILQHYRIVDQDCPDNSSLIRPVEMPGFNSWTTIKTIRYYHRSVTRWPTSTIYIHHRDRLCLKRPAGDFGYFDQKWNNLDNSGRVNRSTTRISCYKKFAKDIYKKS